MRPPSLLLSMALLASLASPLWAIPPLVSGDVPTAPKGVYELFVGHLFVDGGAVDEHEAPFWELVYGLTPRQELTLEGPLLFRDDPDGSSFGFGDVVIGTKYRLLGDPAADSGLSASLEVKLPTGDRDRGLGSGETDVDLRLRAGWVLAREIIYANLGYRWVGEPLDAERDNTWFYSVVWDHPAGKKLRLLTEVYGRTASESGAPNRLAATVGIKWRVRPKQQFHFSVGRSLRKDAKGGPRLRLYTGWRWDF